MPEYLSPGVYVEEVSFRSKSIEGVSTTTTAFVGPTRYGPISGDPQLLTSLLDYERIYGGGGQLTFGADLSHNYMWHAVRAFFDNGGARLYAQRVYRAATATGTGKSTGVLKPATGTPDPTKVLTVQGRFPGAAGNRTALFTLRRGQNVLAAGPTFQGLQDLDVVWISVNKTEPGEATAGFYLAHAPSGATGWTFTPSAGGDDLAASGVQPGRDQVSIVTVAVTDVPSDPNTVPGVWAGIPLDPRHKRGATADSLLSHFAAVTANPDRALTLPIVITAGSAVATGIDVLKAFFAAKTSLAADLASASSSDADRTVEVHLAGGDDGVRPTNLEYAGDAGDVRRGLGALEAVDDISIVAVPGATAGFETGANKADIQTTISLLISHCERMRYRIAVLDSGDGQSIAQVRAMRAAIDSSHAAFYYPWVTVQDPITQAQIPLPPSGFVAGIYARNDIRRAVYKAPANEVVHLAVGFEKNLNTAQQDVLNPEGINCFRYFPGRGLLLWGARTASSDPEWKYVNLRRYFAYLEHSIDKGTQWAVFEPNGDRLWANVRRTVQDFLFNEFQSGALLGTKPDNAFFVKCDRTTMTQNDLDNGRLVCLVGVVPLRPAEFVVFRVGQWTADSAN